MVTDDGDEHWIMAKFKEFDGCFYMDKRNAKWDMARKLTAEERGETP